VILEFNCLEIFLLQVLTNQNRKLALFHRAPSGVLIVISKIINQLQQVIITYPAPMTIVALVSISFCLFQSAIYSSTVIPGMGFGKCFYNTLTSSHSTNKSNNLILTANP